ncbi:hypothetical protein DMENIID0001_082410 [Sergentomyia squamirostris]
MAIPHHGGIGGIGGHGGSVAFGGGGAAIGAAFALNHRKRNFYRRYRGTPYCVRKPHRCYPYRVNQPYPYSAYNPHPYGVPVGVAVFYR